MFLLAKKNPSLKQFRSQIAFVFSWTHYITKSILPFSPIDAVVTLAVSCAAAALLTGRLGFLSNKLTFKLKLANSPIYNKTMTSRYHLLVHLCRCRSTSGSLTLFIEAADETVTVPADPLGPPGSSSSSSFRKWCSQLLRGSVRVCIEVASRWWGGYSTSSIPRSRSRSRISAHRLGSGIMLAQRSRVRFKTWPVKL